MPDEKIQTIKRARMEPIHYAQRFGEVCPYCRSVSVVASGEPLGASRGHWLAPMRCSECGARWQDVYLLTGYLPDMVGSSE